MVDFDDINPSEDVRYLNPELFTPKEKHAVKRGNKYGAKSVVVDGIKFSSRGEAKRYQELRELQNQGIIGGLTLQPRFVLQEGFSLDGKRYSAIKYTADFMYQLDDETVVEEFKGYQTRDYKIRMKLFLKKIADGEIHVVYKVTRTNTRKRKR